MENNQNTTSIFEFNIDDEAKSNFSSIAQWANINAIVGFAGIVMSILGYVVRVGKLSGTAGGSIAVASGFLMLTIVLIISLLLNITLLNAAINIKKSIELTSQNFFVTGLSKLATYFKIFGIILIVVLVLVAFFVLVAIMFSPGRGF